MRLEWSLATLKIYKLLLVQVLINKVLGHKMQGKLNINFFLNLFLSYLFIFY